MDRAVQVVQHCGARSPGGTLTQVGSHRLGVLPSDRCDEGERTHVVARCGAEGVVEYGHAPIIPLLLEQGSFLCRQFVGDKA